MSVLSEGQVQAAGIACGLAARGMLGTAPKPSSAKCNSLSSSRLRALGGQACARHQAPGTLRTTRRTSARSDSFCRSDVGFRQEEPSPLCALGTQRPQMAGANGTRAQTLRRSPFCTCQNRATCCTGLGQWGTTSRIACTHARRQPYRTGWLSCARLYMPRSSTAFVSEIQASLCCSERTSGIYPCELTTNLVT